MSEENATPVTEPVKETPVADPKAATPATPEAPKAPESILGEVKPEAAKPDAVTPTVKVDVPEAYSFTMPDGMEVDKPLADAFTPVAKELGLSNEQANKLASVYAGHVQAETKQLAEAWVKQNETWQGELKADPEFGGARYGQTVKDVHAGILKSGGEALAKALGESGMGDHPEIVKAFARIGRMFREDALVKGNTTPVPKEKAAKEVLFDHPDSLALTGRT